jgi:hypothetical protein
MLGKNVVLAVLAAAVLALPVQALELSVGALAGASHNSYYGMDHQDYLDTNGQSNALLVRPVVGIFGALAFSDLLALQSELILAGTGGKATDDSAPADFWREAYTYLSLPVLVRFSLPVGPGRVRLLAGPAVGVLLGSDYVQEIAGVESSYSDPPPNPVALSAVAAGGYSWAALGGELGFQARLTLGLTPSYEPAEDDDHRLWSLGLLGSYTLGRSWSLGRR